MKRVLFLIAILVLISGIVAIENSNIENVSSLEVYVLEDICYFEGELVINSSIGCCEELDILSICVEEQEGFFKDECKVLDCSYSICSDCGNGVCDDLESYCNCPDDCPKEGNSIFYYISAGMIFLVLVVFWIFKKTIKFLIIALVILFLIFGGTFLFNLFF